ncbi:DUF692 family multinuclear iron-containing protein [Streptomyces sp. NPDC058373]|uniref:multinuclear nonheme iron-dependent oxidase n=1 Tax=Streptomyces sp. NPDC058373 TaxID=3346465 RepID=UPI0036669F23
MERLGTAQLGTGIGWRPAIAEAVEAMAGIEWVEVVAENVCPGHFPDSLRRLRERGVAVVPHGVGLGLGGAERPDPARLAALAERAGALGAPLVTEHIAFVRAGGERAASRGLEAGHLLPVPRTREALAVLCENVRIAQDQLPVPLAVENIAALFSWPDEELTEGQFLYELADRTGVRLLIDVANLHTNHVNQGEDPSAALDALPLEALAYVHVAGGFERDGVWHDSHAHPVPEPVLAVLSELASRVRPPGVLLERDERFPSAAELEAEVARIRETVEAAERAPVTVGAAAPATVGAAASRQRLVTATAPEKAEVDEEAGEAVRTRLALGQTALLSALVAGAPAPEGFDRGRLRVQSRMLTAKRGDIVASLAPELPRILGEAYRPGFLRYAAGRPLTGGHRADALAFAFHTLRHDPPSERGARRELRDWWIERSGRASLVGRPWARWARVARFALLGR